MEPKANFNLLQTISSVYDASKNCKLISTVYKKINPKIDKLAGYFQITNRQAFLLANVYGIFCEKKQFEFNELGKHFGCNQIKVLRFQDDLDIITEKGILIKKLGGRGWLSNTQFYYVEASVNLAIMKNLPLPELKKPVYKDIIELLDKLYTLGQERDEGSISTRNLFEEMKIIMEVNKHFNFIQIVKNMELGNADMYLFMYLCWKTISGKETIDLNVAVDGIFDNSSEKFMYHQSILSRENELIRNKWMELVESLFYNDADIKLTEKSIELLKSENIKLYLKKVKRNDVIFPDKIADKELFFGSSEARQINMLENMLKEENLLPLRQRLKDKSMSMGISVLLYGAAGTGKTESVYQFARKTGREILHVDISESKSMWFGASEKRIKQIFTDYNELLDQSERCPILLFNEADAILSNRKENNYSNVSQTENAMQNIILEEMEVFKGILFATTNLTNNLDNAFERRFLFKVEFVKPDITIRSKIWKSKLCSLSIDESDLLAGNFEFSGGQIDNIVRKCEMDEILNGITPDLTRIIEFCNEELISKACHNSIGYKIKNG